MTGPTYAFIARPRARDHRTSGLAERRHLRGLGVTGLTVAAAVALFGAPVAHAGTLPPAFLQALQAMTTIHSYKMTMDISATGAYPSKSHFVAVFIRNGKALSFDMKAQTTASSGKVSTFEMVLNNTRLCYKGLIGPGWSCSTDSSLATSFESIGDLSKVASSLRSGTNITYLGQKTVQGQRCDGYAETSKTATGSTSGDIWINASTHLFTEEDVVTTSTVSKGAKPTISTVKAVISNYNDSSLSIPKV